MPAPWDGNSRGAVCLLDICFCINIRNFTFTVASKDGKIIYIYERTRQLRP